MGNINRSCAGAGVKVASDKVDVDAIVDGCRWSSHMQESMQVCLCAEIPLAYLHNISETQIAGLQIPIQEMANLSQSR